MFGLDPIAILGSVFLFAVAIGFACSSIDRAKRRFHPLKTAMMVAAAVTVLFLSYLFLTYYFVVQPKNRTALFTVDWSGLAIGNVLLFWIAFSGSGLGYLVGPRRPAVAANAPDDHANGDAARAEETGNPYQPPSV